MRKLHLLCNAHLDPAWLWRRDEGLAEAISTFRVAATFCEQYEGFVFNHNESLLYEWVEEHEPELFERIKKLVKEGKWHIMGGWYLQPDCVMTSGESLLSQIEIGREYFTEKFGVVPTTAANLDSFGHSRGLVQILKATGFDSYLFMRPAKFKGSFMWEGFDGSRIPALNVISYSSHKEAALEKAKTYIESQDSEVGLCLWGIGNHGGGPSRVDLENINAFINETDIEIIHSYAENFFADLNMQKLPIIDRSLAHAMVGCYTTMALIKQANRRLENKIAVTEKIMSYASLQTDFEYDEQQLKLAKKALAFCQFHDILPGTSLKAVERDSLRTLSYGEEIADTLFTKSFFALCNGQKKAEDGTIPILLFNPHPYEIEDEFEVELTLGSQNWNDNEVTQITVYDEEGQKLLSQNEKADSTLNLDWVHKVCFRGKAKPSGITRFNCKMEKIQGSVFDIKPCPQEKINLKNDRMEVIVNCKTGLIEKYTVDGKVLAENTGLLEVYKDNEDPWGMTVESFVDFIDVFELMDRDSVNEFVGYPEENFGNVRVVEDGDVRTRIQTFWKYKSTKAVMEYSIPKHGIYIDIKIDVYSNEPNIMIKYRIDSAFNGTPYGQTAFGVQELDTDRQENVFHKWCSVQSDDSGLAVYNEGIYGGDFTDKTIRLSLLRTPIYSAHPIRKRPIAPHNRFLDHIDMGERSFKFRISNTENIERWAQQFNESPYLITFFPSGKGTEKKSAIYIDNPNIILSSFRKKQDKYRLTLHNTSGEECCANIDLLDKEPMTVSFKKYELKFLEF